MTQQIKYFSSNKSLEIDTRPSLPYSDDLLDRRTAEIDTRPSLLYSDDLLDRRIAGRISCLARAPIYALGALFLTALTVVKFFAAFLVTPLNSCLRDPDLERWTFSGMIKEAKGASGLFDRTLNSLLCFIFAPPKDYYSFEDALLHTIEMTFPYSKLPESRYPFLSIIVNPFIENQRILDDKNSAVFAG